MRHWTLNLMPLAAAALLTACTSTPSTETFVWKGPVSEGTWLRLRNTTGDFTITQGTGDSAEITLEIRRSNAFAPNAQAKVLKVADGVLACVLYGDDNECSTANYRSGNTWKKGFLPFLNGSTNVTGTIVLPRGVKLDVEATNGDVSVAGVTSEMMAATTNGDIEIRGARGSMQASSTNGDVDIEAMEFSQKLTASTTNGDVIVRAPSTINASLSMSTTNGEFDFSGILAKVQSQSKRQVVATLGNGGPPLTLSTTNGDVTLRAIGAP
jgi:hypothetical protein